MTREQKLQQALEELKGFAERNRERALKAFEAAKLAYQETGELTELEDRIGAEARLHEAQRFKDVVVARVKEALS